MAGPPPVNRGDSITTAQAEAMLIRDMKQYEDAVSSAVKVPLNQGQFDALASLCYNIGIGAFRRSTLVRRLNAGAYADVPAQLMRWTRGGGKELPGLVRRRRAEAALWRSLADTATPPTAGRGDVAQVEETETEKPPAKSGTFWSIITSILGAGGLSLSGVDNPWAFGAVALLAVMLGVIGFLIWTGRIVIPNGGE
jgi:lysozyme